MLERVLERVIVLGGVGGLTALAWLDLSRRVDGMGMAVAMPRLVSWSLVASSA